MPNSVELVRLSMLRVLDGVVLPSIELLGGSRNDGASEVGVGGDDGVSEDRSNMRPRGRGFSRDALSSSCGSGWLMVPS